MSNLLIAARVLPAQTTTPKDPPNPLNTSLTHILPSLKVMVREAQKLEAREAMEKMKWDAAPTVAEGKTAEGGDAGGERGAKGGGAEDDDAAAGAKGGGYDEDEGEGKSYK